MKKWQKILIIGFICYVSFYITYGILKSILTDENIIESISSIFFFVPIISYFILKIIKKKIYIKEKEIVSNVSLKILQINNLLKEYHFIPITNINREISEREYSRKSFDRVGVSIDI